MGERKVALNLVGQKYNMLTVIEHHHKTEGNMNYWLCLCDCGNTTIVSTHNLRNNAIKSCGCLCKIIASKSKPFISNLSYFKVFTKRPENLTPWLGSSNIASFRGFVKGFSEFDF